VRRVKTGRFLLGLWACDGFFFSRVEAFGSHVDSVQRFHLCEQIVDNPTLVLIHVCARSIVPFSVLRGTGARLDSLVVCVCAAHAPGRVR
jgi:hypothetical protein